MSNGRYQQQINKSGIGFVRFENKLMRMFVVGASSFTGDPSSTLTQRAC